MKNRAEKGGGLSLEIKAKLYILKYDDVIEDPFDTNTTIFTAKNADYGEAVDIIIIWMMIPTQGHVLMIQKQNVSFKY